MKKIAETMAKADGELKGGPKTILMAYPGRTMSAVIGASVITAGLFVLMVGLIQDDFQPQDTRDVVDLSINPRVEDIDVVMRTIETVDRKEIEVPPPPPRNPTEKASVPSEPIADVFGDIPELPTPDPIGIKPIQIAMVQEGPIVRVPPVMPHRATQSGHCQMSFSLSPEGIPFDIEARSCTEAHFRRPSIKAVEKWRYRPQSPGASQMGRRTTQTKISFRLTDERGQIIPES